MNSKVHAASRHISKRAVKPASNPNIKPILASKVY